MRIRILVASQSQADFYDVRSLGEAPHLAHRFSDPIAHLHDRDLVSDRPGRVFDHAPATAGRRGATAHHGTGGERSPRKHEAEQFAHHIGQELARAWRAGEFERLVVMAGPAFLGLLRKAFPDEVRPSIVAEVTKDLIGHPPHAVQSHLPPEAFQLIAPA